MANMRKNLNAGPFLALAIVVMSLISDAYASDEAVAMLKSARAEERQDGLERLLASGRVSASVFPLLHGIVTRAGDDDSYDAFTDRWLVEKLLVSNGDESSPHLLEWSRDKSKSVRHIAARSFARLGDGPLARDALRAALANEDEEVRRGAAEAFATKVSPKNAVEDLAALASDANQPILIRLLAATPLAREGDVKWVKFLLELSSDGSPEVRAYAYECLALAGQTDSLIDILRNRGEKDLYAASWLCGALATTKSPEASKALQELLDAARAGKKTPTKVESLYQLENALLRSKGLPPKHKYCELSEEDFLLLEDRYEPNKKEPSHAEPGVGADSR